MKTYASRQIIADGLMELDRALTDYAKRYPDERLITVTFVPDKFEGRLWIALWEKTKTLENEK